ncbi:MAG: alpha/beta-hydrolase family protein [Actinomycetota bacterium]
MTGEPLNWIARAGIRLAATVNPVTGGPAAPLRASALLDSFGPSLMPRKSLHQGVASGLALLTADLVGYGVDAVARRVAPADSPLVWRIGSRAAIAGVATVLAGLDETDEEPTSRATLRSSGRLAAVGALGGIINEAGRDLERRSGWSLLPVVTGLGGFSFLVVRLARELETRLGLIERLSEDDEPASLPASLSIALGLGLAGRMVARGFLTSQQSLVTYLGGDGGRRIIAKTLNTGLWSAGAIASYLALVDRLSRDNSRVEPGFSMPPSNQYVSGGPNSVSPFEELGLQGRRFVTETMAPDEIDESLGESGAKHPIRVYVGVDSEPLYSTGRSELALEEMERLGAFERKHLLLVSPTGTGWVDHTMVETAEILTRGDIATVCIQYGKAPSFLEIHGVALGRSQFRQLLWGVRQRLLGVPEADRPKVMVFGESLGAWSSSDVIMHLGIAGFDHYGIESALWFGLPGLARWSRTGMREGRNPLTPEGTVAAFDRFDQYSDLSEEERRALRAVVVDHNNDPISQMSLRLAVKRPAWLDGERRRNVPDAMRWHPLVTFIQVVADAMNAMVAVPGEFKSFGHDYRAETLDFVGAVYDLPEITRDQSRLVREALVRRELDRARRIEAGEMGEIRLSPERMRGSIQ